MLRRRDDNDGEDLLGCRHDAIAEGGARRGEEKVVGNGSTNADAIDDEHRRNDTGSAVFLFMVIVFGATPISFVA